MYAEPQQSGKSWPHIRRPLTLAELIADGVVHVLGLLVALVAGSVLVTLALVETAPEEVPALLIYLASLVVVLAVSMAFNLWPESKTRHYLARLDQAAIFVFIAGSYTPFLAIIGGTWAGHFLTAVVWGGAITGGLLKLIVPQRFGRLAIPFYLGIGWSGVLVFKPLVATLPESAVWLIVAGGIAYSCGVIFHLWEKLHFQNVVWHAFVVAGASLHLAAIFDVMVISRL